MSFNGCIAAQLSSFYVWPRGTAPLESRVATLTTTFTTGRLRSITMSFLNASPQRNFYRVRVVSNAWFNASSWHISLRDITMGKVVFAACMWLTSITFIPSLRCFRLFIFLVQEKIHWMFSFMLLQIEAQNLRHCAAVDEILWCLFLQETLTVKNIYYILNLALDDGHHQLVYPHKETSIELRDHNAKNNYGISETRHLAVGSCKISKGKTVSQFIKL